MLILKYTDLDKQNNIQRCFGQWHGIDQSELSNPIRIL